MPLRDRFYSPGKRAELSSVPVGIACTHGIAFLMLACYMVVTPGLVFDILKNLIEKSPIPAEQAAVPARLAWVSWTSFGRRRRPIRSAAADFNHTRAQSLLCPFVKSRWRRALPSPELTVAQMIHQLHNSAVVHTHTTSILQSGVRSLVEECVMWTAASTSSQAWEKSGGLKFRVTKLTKV